MPGPSPMSRSKLQLPRSKGLPDLRRTSPHPCRDRNSHKCPPGEGTLLPRSRFPWLRPRSRSTGITRVLPEPRLERLLLLMPKSRHLPPYLLRPTSVPADYSQGPQLRVPVFQPAFRPVLQPSPSSAPNISDDYPSILRVHHASKESLTNPRHVNLVTPVTPGLFT